MHSCSDLSYDEYDHSHDHFLYHSLYTHHPDAVTILDRAGSILYMNPAAENMLDCHSASNWKKQLLARRYSKRLI